MEEPFYGYVSDNAPQFPNEIAYGNVTKNGIIGMYVMTMEAEDYDNINEGTKTKVIYSIDFTDLPILDVNPDTGFITTAVKDLNDMPPRFTKDEWFLEVEETDANFHKKPVTKDDIRENIINYCDEGGGENDMTAFDMKTLKIPIDPLPELVQHNAPPVRK
uniref:Uncharacterized protein n=1 Tax=Anopheles quadriannulatus TaxID=34691 RepID=A0A182WZK0_ANOQN